MKIDEKVRFYKAWQDSETTDEVIKKLEGEAYMKYRRGDKKGQDKTLKDKRLELTRFRNDFRAKKIDIKDLKAASSADVDDTDALLEALKKEGVDVKMVEEKPANKKK